MESSDLPACPSGEFHFILQNIKVNITLLCSHLSNAQDSSVEALVIDHFLR